MYGPKRIGRGNRDGWAWRVDCELRCMVGRVRDGVSCCGGWGNECLAWLGSVVMGSILYIIAVLDFLHDGHGGAWSW